MTLGGGGAIFPHAKRNQERRGRSPLTYSDGVSSPHQSRMAANPLRCFYRGEKGEQGVERDGGVKKMRQGLFEWGGQNEG